jgi:replicative DNA helicase Mcm
VPGTIVGISSVWFKIKDAVFLCARCGTLLKEPQGDLLTSPLECYEEQGGCKRSAGKTKFELVPEACTWVNAQRIEIQENADSTAGALAQKLTCIIHGNDESLIRKVRGGKRVVVWGIVGAQESKGKDARAVWERYLDVQGIADDENAPDEETVSAEDEARIQAIAATPEAYEGLRDSLAPHVFGYDDVKESIVLQLFGGVYEEPDQRGDIHQILVGDPSVAKTQLLMAARKVAPRGQFVTASQATRAGLTAYVEQQNQYGAIRWVAEAGALPLADLAGILCIDELDKMNPEDRRRVNSALDPQFFSVVKAGTNLTMVSRVPVLAAANPMFARFDEHKYVAEQIQIEPDTLSRFDCVWPILDRPDKERDAEIARLVLRRKERPAPRIDDVLFRKYLTFARRIKPEISPEAEALITDFYVQERQKSWGQGAVAMTVRQLGGLRRFAQASARVQLRNVVTAKDALRAIRLMSTWLTLVASEGGVLDSDIFQTGISHSQREAILTLRDILGDLAGPGGVADYEDIVRMAQERGIPPAKVDAWLKRWSQEGEIYSPAKNKYKLVEKL